ncbi:hypothetical protein LP419_05695 [Massilia sp. H-1]|nr:hypothetical protein LP419_05695 [Massilia sp. H-1]
MHHLEHQRRQRIGVAGADRHSRTINHGRRCGAVVGRRQPVDNRVQQGLDA